MSKFIKCDNDFKNKLKEKVKEMKEKCNMDANQKMKNILRIGWSDEIKNKIKPLNDLITRIKIGHDDIILDLIRHYDLDGIGTEVVLRVLEETIPNFYIGNIYEEPTCADASYKEYIKSDSLLLNDGIIIADLSFKDHLEFAEIIHNYYADCKPIILDHHISAEWMNSYPCAFVKPHDTENYIVSSGTVLVFEAFKDLCEAKLSANQLAKLEKIVSWIGASDTYFFKDQPKISQSLYGDYPHILNNLFKYYNNPEHKKAFINNMISNILDETITSKELIDKGCMLISEMQDSKIKELVDMAKSDHIVKENTALWGSTIDGISNKAFNVVVYYYSGLYTSEIGNALCEDENIDYALIIDMNKKKCGLRTKKDINLAEMVKHIPGSGGHPKACGFGFTNNIIFKDNFIYLE